jgi:hypothetical protein
MEAFFIVLVFWTLDGELGKQTSNLIPTAVECERLLANDLADRRKIFGNAEGVCVRVPAKPDNVPMAPQGKKQWKTA